MVLNHMRNHTAGNKTLAQLKTQLNASSDAQTVCLYYIDETWGGWSIGLTTKSGVMREIILFNPKATLFSISEDSGNTWNDSLIQSSAFEGDANTLNIGSWIQGSRILVNPWLYVISASLSFTNGHTFPQRAWTLLWTSTHKPAFTQRHHHFISYGINTVYLFYVEFRTDGTVQAFNAQTTDITLTDFYINDTYSLV